MKKADSPFFVAINPKRKENDQVWYKRCPLGKNQLGKFLSAAADAAGLQAGSKKLSNHSVRKTSIGTLLEANFPENYVMQLSGHKNIQSLGAYKSAYLRHQRQMSDTLSRNQAEISPQPTPSIVNIVSSSRTSSSTAHAVFACARISAINNCTFQIMTGPVTIAQESSSAKRPRHEEN